MSIYAPSAARSRNSLTAVAAGQSVTHSLGSIKQPNPRLLPFDCRFGRCLGPRLWPHGHYLTGRR